MNNRKKLISGGIALVLALFSAFNNFLFNFAPPDPKGGYSISLGISSVLA